MDKLLTIGIGVSLILSTYGSAGGQGYSIRGDQVVIDRAAEWKAWSFPTDIAEVTAAGQVRPRLIRRDTDAVEEMAAFGGGILAAGSSPEDVENFGHAGKDLLDAAVRQTRGYQADDLAIAVIVVSVDELQWVGMHELPAVILPIQLVQHFPMRLQHHG